MIEVVLNQHRHARQLTILRGSLPATPEVRFALLLHDERPLLDLSWTHAEHRPFSRHLLERRQFVAWQEAWTAVASGQINRIDDPDLSYFWKGEEKRAVLVRFHQDLRLYTNGGACLEIPHSHIPVWDQDLGRTLDLAIRIDEYVSRRRASQRGDLLNHVDSLLMRVFLG